MEVVNLRGFEPFFFFSRPTLNLLDTLVNTVEPPVDPASVILESIPAKKVW